MSSLISQRARFEEARELDFGSVTGSFVAVGAAFTEPIRQLIIQNFTNQALDFSVSADGVTSHISLMPSTSYVSDICANQDDISGGFYISQGDSVWVRSRGTAPTSGFVQVATIYGF